MDSKKLKKDFGDCLTFWGGGVDTQKVVPTGKPSEVWDEVKRRIEDLAPGGGFVFNTVHNIQPDVPPENLATCSTHCTSSVAIKRTSECVPMWARMLSLPGIQDSSKRGG